MKYMLIAFAVIVVFLCGGSYFLYNKGYQNGVQFVEAQVAELNKEHELKIEQLQKQHNEYVQSIELKYTYQVGQLNEQVAELEKNKTLYDKYIGTYIPSNQYNYVPNGFVLWHDRAAKGERLDKIVLQDQLDNPSKYTFNDTMYAVGYNYTQANVCFTKLTSLQNIVKDYMKKQQPKE